MSESSIYLRRRTRILDQMDAGVAIVPTAAERLRNRDAHYPYRFDSYFFYLSGFREPDAVLALVAGDKPKSVLFCRENDPEREVWDGPRLGPAAAKEALSFDEAHPIGRLDALMPELLANQRVVYCHLGADGTWDERVIGWINEVRNRARSGVSSPCEIKDVHSLLDEMRLIKSPEELATMRRAAAISTAAHRRAMLAVHPGRSEYEIEAELLHEFRRHGAQAPAYSPIVASGANACVLHYIQNDARTADGDLLLIDAGCELDGYASDITRTFPVNGRFSGPQRDIYDLVLAAQAAAILEVRSGSAWNKPHEAAVKVLAQGFLDLGLLSGSVDQVLETESYKKYYMHRTGHWLGLDVHDAGSYKRGDEWRKLEPGMVLTVEPGCYVRVGDGVPEKFANIGIRIEDNVLVTQSDCEVLTSDAPKTIADIEELMRERHG